MATPKLEQMYFTLWTDRDVLTDVQWAKMGPQYLGKPTDPGRRRRNNWLFLEAILGFARTGSPWRDLVERVGN